MTQLKLRDIQPQLMDLESRINKLEHPVSPQWDWFDTWTIIRSLQTIFAILLSVYFILASKGNKETELIYSVMYNVLTVLIPTLFFGIKKSSHFFYEKVFLKKNKNKSNINSYNLCGIFYLFLINSIYPLTMQFSDNSDDHPLLYSLYVWSNGVTEFSGYIILTLFVIVIGAFIIYSFLINYRALPMLSIIIIIIIVIDILIEFNFSKLLPSFFAITLLTILIIFQRKYKNDSK